MVHNELWEALTQEFNGAGFLCIGCLEHRLGRHLKSSDFTEVPVNEIFHGRKTARLLNRLGLNVEKLTSLEKEALGLTEGF